MVRMLAEVALSLALAKPSGALLARAESEHKPVVVLFREPVCQRCDVLERETLVHPTIQRRLPAVVFGIEPAATTGLALFDRRGRLYATWPFVPATTNLGIILESIAVVAPYLERAASRPDADAQVEIGTVLALLGRPKEARAALARAQLDGSVEARQAAAVTNAILDANEGEPEKALEALEPIAAEPATPQIAEDARRAIEAIHKAATPVQARVIRLIPPRGQLIRGSRVLRALVGSDAVARVDFILDGELLTRVHSEPFLTSVDFGSIPERHSILAVAFDRKGRELGRDQRVVNEAGETFRVRLIEPRAGAVQETTRVVLDVRTPAGRKVRRVALSWNEAERAVLTHTPWDTEVRIPSGTPGVLRAVAELDDGRTVEDAVLLNAPGYAGDASVQLVQLPITVLGGAIEASALEVREGTRLRRVEALAGPSETPLTVGLLMDVSDSVHKTLPDLQEAAIQFLRATLGSRDRAFLVSFDSRVRLVQPATSDRDLLEKAIMRLRPDGLTSLYDAMMLGLLQFEGVQGRRAMIVFSDGIDRTSAYRAADVKEMARRANVPIHVIEAIPVEENDGALLPLAKSTGGTAHQLATLDALPTAYEAIQASLRAQFLAFIRTEPASRDNEWRKVTVSSPGPKPTLLAPEGYYAGR